MNDAAAAALDLFTGFERAAGELSPGLRSIADRGIEVRGEVVVWTGGARRAEPPPGRSRT